MSIPKALEIAHQAGVDVGPVHVAGDIQSRVVGNYYIAWDRTKGGSACWMVYQRDGSPVMGTHVQLRGFQGEAIAHAVRAQSTPA